MKPIEITQQQAIDIIAKSKKLDKTKIEII